MSQLFNHVEMEDGIENAVAATTLLFNILGGLGLFYTGVGVLRNMTVYKQVHKEPVNMWSRTHILRFMCRIIKI